MQCKFYENVCCILTDITDKEPNDYCCYNCLIHIVVEYDNELDKNPNLN